MKPHLPAATLLCVAASAFAQNNDHAEPPRPQKFYKLQVRVEQFDGSKPIKSQEVAMTVPLGNRRAHIRSGEKIPFFSGSSQENMAQYQDVGLNVDYNDVEETGSGLSIAMKVEVSAAVAVESGKLPLLRQYNWDSNVMVPLGKAVTVYSDADSNTQYKMEVKVIATPLDLR